MSIIKSNDKIFDNNAYKLDSKIIAEPLYDRILHATNTRYLNKRPTVMALISDDNNMFIYKYVEITKNNCIKNGIIFNIHIISKLSVESYIKWGNNDPDIDGIIVYYPFFGNILHKDGGLMDDYIKDLINYKKDVEGLSHYYRFNLYHDIKSNIYFTPLHNIAPCNALAVIKCLEYLNLYNNLNLPYNKLCDKKITIINRNNLIGKPLAILLANDGADVYSVDDNSIFLMRKEATGKIYGTNKTREQACMISDVIILGLSNNDYKLETKYIKENTIIINIYNYKNVYEDEIMKIKGIKYISPITKLTIAMLQYNILSLCDCFRNT